MSNPELGKWKNYGGWLEHIPKWITSDPLWDFQAYRKALFLSELAYQDCEQLSKDGTARHLKSQLIRSATSPAANIEEGYGRGYGKDYARFLRIVLGSARETRGWYFRLRHALPLEVVEFRVTLLTELIRLIRMLTITAKQQKNYKATSN